MGAGKRYARAWAYNFDARPPRIHYELRPDFLALQRQFATVAPLISFIKCGKTSKHTGNNCHQLQKQCNLMYCGHIMQLSWMLYFFNIIAIFSSLCILSSANPTFFSLAKCTANHDLHLNKLSHPLESPLPFPSIHPISKRSPSNGVSYNFWGNGWTSRSYTFARTPPPPQKKPTHLEPNQQTPY